MSRPGSREELQFLRASPVFAALPAHELEIPRDGGARGGVPSPRIPLLRERSSAVALSRQGRARADRASLPRTRKDVVLELLGPGEIFGGVAVIERRPYPASAQATRRVRPVTRHARARVIAIDVDVTAPSPRACGLIWWHLSAASALHGAPRGRMSFPSRGPSRSSLAVSNCRSDSGAICPARSTTWRPGPWR
jgi:hypothetical protein